MISYQTLFDLERALARYTGAPYVVVTDGCTHAIELAMRWYRIQTVEFTAFTYLSVPQAMSNLGIKYRMIDEPWQGEYRFHGSNIWDSARRLMPEMYRPGQIQCLSFGITKPIAIGKLGAILLDDSVAFDAISLMRADGRDLRQAPWQDQKIFGLGYHYCPTLEDCNRALKRLHDFQGADQTATYPDCRQLVFIR